MPAKKKIYLSRNYLSKAKKYNNNLLLLLYITFFVRNEINSLFGILCLRYKHSLAGCREIPNSLEE